jgi:hypothetical protein
MGRRNTRGRVVEAAVRLFNERGDGGGLYEPHCGGGRYQPGQPLLPPSQQGGDRPGDPEADVRRLGRGLGLARRPFARRWGREGVVGQKPRVAVAVPVLLQGADRAPQARPRARARLRGDPAREVGGAGSLYEGVHRGRGHARAGRSGDPSGAGADGPPRARAPRRPGISTSPTRTLMRRTSAGASSSWARAKRPWARRGTCRAPRR